MSDDLLHGGAIDALQAAYPDAPTPWIDLSTGINPWPYPNTAVSPSHLHRLPTASAMQACRQSLAENLGVSPDAIVLAPGSELLIRLLPDAIRPRQVAMASPTYADHKHVWSKAGADIIETKDSLQLASNVDAIVVTHPNNPDGRVFNPNLLEKAREELAARGGWLFLDEAYADLMPERSLAHMSGAAGLIILRSFGKFYGLAGLRLGALLAPDNVQAIIADKLGSWPISGPALEIGARAFADKAWQDETRQSLNAAAARLDTILTRGGLRVLGGTDLFRFVDAGDAHAVFDHLAQAGVYVRRFDWSREHLRFGLPANAEEERRLAEALTLLA